MFTVRVERGSGYINAICDQARGGEGTSFAAADPNRNVRRCWILTCVAQLDRASWHAHGPMGTPLAGCMAHYGLRLQLYGRKSCKSLWEKIVIKAEHK